MVAADLDPGGRSTSQPLCRQGELAGTCVGWSEEFLHYGDDIEDRRERCGAVTGSEALCDETREDISSNLSRICD